MHYLRIKRDWAWLANHPVQHTVAVEVAAAQQNDIAGQRTAARTSPPDSSGDEMDRSPPQGRLSRVSDAVRTTHSFVCRYPFVLGSTVI